MEAQVLDIRMVQVITIVQSTGGLGHTANRGVKQQARTHDSWVQSAFWFLCSSLILAHDF